MAHIQTTDEAPDRLLFPALPAADIQELAALIMLEIESQPDLPAHVRGALISTAADFAKHGHDCLIAESQTSELLGRMALVGGASAN